MGDLVKRGYIVGAGAQGRIIAEVWRAQCPDIQLQFLDDNPALHDTFVLGIAVAGPVCTLKSVDLRHAEVVLAIGNNLRRLELAVSCGPPGIVWGNAVHPSATIMPSADIGGGTVVFAHAVINSGARVGQHVIVNTSALVEHDTVVEDGASLSPGVCMGGRVRIGRAAFISAGVTIAPRITIGAGSIIGAGATVLEDIPPRVLAYGVPARVIRPLTDSFEFGRLL
jgi:acetyltransferase EpsM